MKAIKRFLGYCLAAIPLGFSAIAIVLVPEPVRAQNNQSDFTGHAIVGFSDESDKAYGRVSFIETGTSDQVSDFLHQLIMGFKKLVREIHKNAILYTIKFEILPQPLELPPNHEIERFPEPVNLQSDMGQLEIVYSDSLSDLFFGRAFFLETGESPAIVSDLLYEIFRLFSDFVLEIHPSAIFWHKIDLYPPASIDLYAPSHKSKQKYIALPKQVFVPYTLSRDSQLYYFKINRNLVNSRQIETTTLTETAQILLSKGAKSSAKASEHQTLKLFAAIEAVVEDLDKLESDLKKLTPENEGLNMAALNSTMDSVSSMRGSVSVLVAELNRLPKDGSPEQLFALANMLENAENAVTSLEEPRGTISTPGPLKALQL